MKNIDRYFNDATQRGRKQDKQIKAIKARLVGLKPPPRGGLSSYFESIQRSTNEFVRRRMKNPKNFRGIAFWG